jgi:hypothetical protein
VLYLYRNKIICLLALLVLSTPAFSQKRRGGPINDPLYDYKKIHFGFSLGVTRANFKVELSPDFLDIDTLQRASVQPSPGLYLGAVADLRMGDHFNLRFIPDLSFAQRNMIYQFRNETRNIKVESAYLDFPIMVKFKSVRHRNVRFYVIAGAKYSYDLTSNKDAARSNNKPVVAVLPHNYAYELGFGLDFYYPWFKFSPEIKICNGFNNVLSRDDYVYTKSLTGLYSKIFQICLHFE